MKPNQAIQEYYLPPRYTTIGEPVVACAIEPSTRDELRVTRTLREGEDAPRIDVRVWTVHGDGSGDTAHKAGLRLTCAEAAALLNALQKVLQDA